MKYFSFFKKGEYGTFLWNDVALHKGTNEIIARAQQAEKIKSCWNGKKKSVKIDKSVNYGKNPVGGR